jgi:putative DNA primase/helicase
LLFLSTGEQSLSDKITESGGTVKGGQDIRLCDIEADTGKFGLFEDLHDFPSGQAFSDHLRAASCKFYGTPIREFLTQLTEFDHSGIRDQWHVFKDTFTGDVLPIKEKVPSEVFRVAARFALVALGGELATEAGITKWQKGEAADDQSRMAQR